MMTEEKVGVLSKLADVVGKKTLAVWAIMTTLTTGYLFIENKTLHNKLLSVTGSGYERLIDEIKGIRHTTQETKSKVDSTIGKLDTTITNAKETLDDLQKRKKK